MKKAILALIVIIAILDLGILYGKLYARPKAEQTVTQQTQSYELRVVRTTKPPGKLPPLTKIFSDYETTNKIYKSIIALPKAEGTNLQLCTFRTFSVVINFTFFEDKKITDKATFTLACGYWMEVEGSYDREVTNEFLEDLAKTLGTTREKLLGYDVGY